MLLIGRQDVEEIVAGVEWTTILFFTGLFIVVGGLQETGVIQILANGLMDLTEGHMILDHSADPLGLGHCLLVPGQHPLCGHPDSPDPHHAEQRRGCHPPVVGGLPGACLGGNGTLIGASANVVLSGISNRHGFPITFASYFKVGFPLMLVSVAISTVFLLLRFT